MTSPRGQLCRCQQWALLTSALTKTTLTVEWSTGSVGSACQWVPLVSLTSDAYKWGPRVRFKKEKGKGKGAAGFKGRTGPVGSAQRCGGSALGGGPARETACRPARCGSEQKGRLGYSAQRAGPTGRKRPIATSPPPLLFTGGSWADGAQAAHFSSPFFFFSLTSRARMAVRPSPLLASLASSDGLGRGAGSRTGTVRWRGEGEARPGGALG